MISLQRLEGLYLATLGHRLGLPCELADPGLLFVEVGERQCFVLLDPDDPGFLRLGTTEALPEGTPDASAAAAVEFVNRRCPGVKATLNDGRDVVVLAAEVVVAAEGCPPQSAHLAAVVDRMTGAVLDAAEQFGDDLVLRDFASDPAFGA